MLLKSSFDSHSSLVQVVISWYRDSVASWPIFFAFNSFPMLQPVNCGWLPSVFRVSSKLSNTFDIASQAPRDLAPAHLSSHLSSPSVSVAAVLTFCFFLATLCSRLISLCMLWPLPLPPPSLYTWPALTPSLGPGFRFSFFWTPILTLYSRRPFNASSAIPFPLR